MVEYCEYCGEELDQDSVSSECNECGYDPNKHWICDKCGEFKDKRDDQYEVVDEFLYPLTICEECYRDAFPDND